MAELLTADDFEPHVGTPFRVLDESVEVLLAELERHPSQEGLERQPFALVFTGPTAPLEQRTYRLGHDQMGELDIFLVPIGPGTDGLPRYQAVFS